MSETQVLMTISDFGVFFSKNHFLWKGMLSWEGASFLSEGHTIRAWVFDGGGFQKNS